jgi:hypothetical protein
LLKLGHAAALAFLIVALGALASAAQCAIVTDGLILHLDAAEQVRVGGSGPGNVVWKNLADQPDSIAGSGKLLHFGSSASSGWSGSGQPGDPYALRFDGQKDYVEGSGNLEIKDLTIEVWAFVECVTGASTQRGATLIGNDFGKGGIGLLVTRDGSALLLHGATFHPMPVDIPLRRWMQVAVSLKDETARVYVNGDLAFACPAPRELQPSHYPAYQLGVARFPEMDYVASDGLSGAISIVRVYSRALSSDEIKRNFGADCDRIGVKPIKLVSEPVSSMPVPRIPGVGSPAPVRCMKWDYYYNPLSVGGTEIGASGARWAFDGYPTAMSQPTASTYWQAEVKPDQPAYVVIDYKHAVAVTRFVSYFDRSRNPAAWKDVEILTSADAMDWKLLQSLSDLPPACPQVLGIDKPVLSRFYKIVVKSLARGAAHVATHEIETYYGATVGNIASTQPIQSEPVKLSVRVVSPDAGLRGGTLKLTSPAGSLQGPSNVALPAAKSGGSSAAVFTVTPLCSGQIPVLVSLYAGGNLIDKRPYTIFVLPKLVLTDISPSGAVLAKAGDTVVIKGTVANSGEMPASKVRINWLGATVSIGGINPGLSVPFEIKAKARPGYDEGLITATAYGQTKSVLRRGVICRSAGELVLKTLSSESSWTTGVGIRKSPPRYDDGIKVSVRAKGVSQPVTGTLRLLVDSKPCELAMVAAVPHGEMVAPVPGGVLLVKVRPSATASEDTALEFTVVPDDPSPLATQWLDLEVRVAVDKPKIMFRPHIDWYTVEHGPNFAQPTNGHNSATRMLCIQTTAGATVSMVPDTDNMTWGFTQDNAMTASFQIPLAPHDPLGTGIWRPITVAPATFAITLPVRKGDWFDAYRHVVHDIFKFEEPRQWAMPITQMQMLAERSIMSYGAWSEKWQTVRSFSNDGMFMNFYGAHYTLPALYSWYLATDDPVAKTKAEKVVDWLLRIQYNEGPMSGGWFSVYFDKGGPELVGSDFIQNRWLIPQSTGATVRTLLWYWNVSGQKDSRVFDAAMRGSRWLLKTLRPDGGWPYAFDLDGNAITDACGAGQIWCTWALWDMYKATGDTQYKAAAIRSKDFFKKNYMDVHRYVGYWEDTVGITKEQNKKINSWECYEAALAVLVFSEMGEKALAVEAAKDLAAHSWTRVTSTRQYETSLGETTEQSLCGPSQAQSPMVGIAFKQVYQLTGDSLWNDLAGATKTINFCADPERGYGCVATSGWCDPLNAVAGPPYDNVRPFVSPDMAKGDYGRQLWYQWCTDQFAWLALNWLVREGNIRAPQYVSIDTDSLRGTVLGQPGRVKLPEEKCDVNGIDHYDINWVGYCNDTQYLLLVMNHKQKVTVAIRPHEAHLDVYCRPPRILVGNGKSYEEVKVVKKGVQYLVTIPEKQTALLIWDRIK